MNTLRAVLREEAGVEGDGGGGDDAIIGTSLFADAHKGILTADFANHLGAFDVLGGSR